MNAMEGYSVANRDLLLTSRSFALAADPLIVFLRDTILSGFPNEKCASLRNRIMPTGVQSVHCSSMDNDVVMAVKSCA